ncbi:hypothetical protein [Xanthomarina sp. F2636L]|uniref:hypothetical protein n=1 Tax=Xanthomarina sp. F2636L TaxID=2996018 RepID=UPI00225E291D|nr:hypothetical protein [Xanthomarina sp. F2636L]MCX7550674.1 hypothetical protein [Xanthomarina sp. F2636L]
MKNLIFIFLIILWACNKENEPNNDVETSHISYFGFTLIVTYWDDPTDSNTKTNYLNEVSDFSNIADILILGPSDNIIESLNQMNAVDVKSILHLSDLFFEVTGTNSPSGLKHSLRLDFESRWNKFVQTNNLQDNKNLVQAFYIGEEPTWNGISFNELQMASSLIKSSIPDIPILIIEAYPVIDQLEVPGSIDWVGFDHYAVKDPENNPQFLNEFHLLKSKLSNEQQKIVLVMDTHYIPSLHGTYGHIALEDMADVANSYYNLAKKEPKVIAILGYFWPSGFDNLEAIGARNMPLFIKENYIRIGKEITLKK